jgi:Ca2+-binding EF-hand superfamily protein
MTTNRRPNPRSENLTEVTIAEIREIFTLFDKNADSYVSTSELGTIIRGLKMNPTEREVANMQKQVDPQGNGSFDINALVSLVALQPKQNDTLEDMIESLRIVGNDQMAMDGDKDKVPKMMSIETLRSTVMSNGKELGEALMEH